MGSHQSKTRATSHKQAPTSGDQKVLVFIGDSTLDNVVWVKNYSHSIKYKLLAKLSNFQIVNLAADGFTSESVVKGGRPMISWQARHADDPFPTSNNEVLYPLAQYEKLSRVDYAVLSIGGNDLRTILSSPAGIQMASAALINNYSTILRTLLKKTSCVVIMMQYRPSMTQKNYGIYESLGKLPVPGTPLEKMNRLMEQIYPSILEVARKYKIPVIDLPNTFDVQDSNLYVSQIEPSSKGGEVIAELIDQVVQKHHFEGDSQFYYKDLKAGILKQYSLKENESWRVFNNYGSLGQL